MAAFKHLKAIEFERNSLVFTAGDSIKGSLIFDDADRPFKIYDVHILLTGVVRQCNYYRPYIEHKRHLSDYFYKILTTYSQTRITKLDTEIQINPKTKTEVPFELEIPISLWSTFIGGLGYTVYRLIIVGRPNSPVFAKEGVLYHNEIVIIGQVDPIKDGFTAPVNETKLYTSKTGDAKLSLTMDKSWASPGEMFSFKVIAENGLKLPLSSIKMIFQQNVTYDFKGNPKLFAAKDQEVIILVQKEGPSVPPGPGRRIVWNYSFQIPHTVPSNLGAEGCKLIKLNYCICFVLAKFVNLKIMVPIHIGTSTDVDWGEASLEYGKELKRSLSSQSLAAWDNELGASCWSLMDAVGDSGGGGGSSKGGGSDMEFSHIGKF